MFKKILSLITLGCLISSAYACWFTADNFNGNYIAGVNNYVAHYRQVDGINNAVYHNNQEVDLPLTVFVKVSPRFSDQPGETAGPKQIISARLEYKIYTNGKWQDNWTLVKKIENVSWEMNWNHPIALFGRNNIYVRNAKKGDKLMLRLYLSDGTYETGDPAASLSTDEIPNEATHQNGAMYSGGWTAPFIFVVTLSGKDRPVL